MDNNDYKERLVILETKTERNGADLIRQHNNLNYLKKDIQTTFKDQATLNADYDKKITKNSDDIASITAIVKEQTQITQKLMRHNTITQTEKRLALFIGAAIAVSLVKLAVGNLLINS